MEKYEIIKRLRVYMDEANGEGAWKPYVGSQLEADVANFIITEALHQPLVVGRSEQLQPEQECYKIGELCKYNCSGLCKESF